MPEIKTIIALDTEIKKKAKMLAVKNDTTLKDIINTLLREYVEEHE